MAHYLCTEFSDRQNREGGFALENGARKRVRQTVNTAADISQARGIGGRARCAAKARSLARLPWAQLRQRLCTSKLMFVNPKALDLRLERGSWHSEFPSRSRRA